MTIWDRMLENQIKNENDNPITLEDLNKPVNKTKEKSDKEKSDKEKTEKSKDSG